MQGLTSVGRWTGESIVGVRSLNAVEAINDYLHFNLSRLRAVGLLRRLKSAKYVRFKSSK